MPQKNPYLAAFLNFLLFGGGTLYVGKRVVPAVFMTLGGTLAQITEIYMSPPCKNLIPNQWPFLIVGLIVLKIGLAIDGYNEAQAVNAGG